MIVLGASKFDSGIYEEAPALANAARQLTDRLSSADCWSIDQGDILWLFDTGGAIDACEKAKTFSSQRAAAADLDGLELLVVTIFVGHGAMFGERNKLSLVLRDTRQPFEIKTSIQASDLSVALRSGAPRASHLVILDCCFAALAVSSFQAPTAEAVESSYEDFALQAGTTLICAAEARETTNMIPEELTTSFSKRLIEILDSGDPKRRGGLRARDVVAMLGEHGYCFSPDQPGGFDLAEIELFPNNSIRTDKTVAASQSATPKNATKIDLQAALSKRAGELLEDHSSLLEARFRSVLGISDDERVLGVLPSVYDKTNIATRSRLSRVFFTNSGLWISRGRTSAQHQLERSSRLYKYIHFPQMELVDYGKSPYRGNIVRHIFFIQVPDGRFEFPIMPNSVGLIIHLLGYSRILTGSEDLNVVVFEGCQPQSWITDFYGFKLRD